MKAVKLFRRYEDPSEDPEYSEVRRQNSQTADNNQRYMQPLTIYRPRDARIWDACMSRFSS